MDGITLQPIHPQACESFEVPVESTQGRPMLDGDGGEMSVADEITAAPGAEQQAREQRRVAFRGPDDPRMGM